MRALRATPRGEESPRNGGWWDVAHHPASAEVDSGEAQLRKPGLLRGLGRDLRWAWWGRSWLGGGVGMSPEQAALEVDRVVRLGRPVRNRRGLATRHWIILDNSTSQALTGDPLPRSALVSVTR